MRIVSLVCSNTEILAALGGGGCLVGVDDHSDHPMELVQGLPRLGPDLQIRMDEVEELQPDLVLASLTVPGHETVVEALEVRGIPCLALEAGSLADVYENIRELARALVPWDPGVEERGEALVRTMQSRLQSRAGSEGAPRILVQWWPKPVISPGRRSWTHDVLEAAGAVNASGQHDGPSRPYSWAEVVELAPDAIVISWCGVAPERYRPDVVLGNPDLQATPAVRQGRVFPVPEALLGRPGPRLLDGLRALEEVVQECR